MNWKVDNHRLVASSRLQVEILMDCCSKDDDQDK
jgi:hypothetical protein